MTKTIDPETREAIIGALATIQDIERIANLYGVKKSTVARIKMNQPMKRVNVGHSNVGEPAEPTQWEMDSEEATKMASARLRGAVRGLLNVRAKRLGIARPDWVSFDDAEAHRNEVWRTGRSL